MKNFKNAIVNGSLLSVLISCFVIFMGVAQVVAEDNCRKIYPNPKIKFDHQDAAGRIYISVVNWSAYDNEMFRKAPDLPPCGVNTNSARAWVDIYNADTNASIYGFCAFASNNDLKGIWFKPSTPKGRVYIVINDRACKKKYKSNIVAF
jgi:hypothetical protein